MVPKDELDMDSSNKISFLNKNPFFDLFHLFHERKRGGYTLRHDFESEERFQEMADHAHPPRPQRHHLSNNITIFRRDLLKISQKGYKTARRKSRRKNFPMTVPAVGRSDIPRVFASFIPSIATQSGTE